MSRTALRIPTSKAQTHGSITSSARMPTISGSTISRSRRAGSSSRSVPTEANSFKMVPYPRAVKNIIVRTATPDSQFAAPGTALGGMQWNSLMAWMTNTAANRCSGCTPAVELQPSGDTFTQIMATNITFVGIAFTVADDPVAKGEIDPAPWNYLVRMQQSTQNIIFDRCALFMPSASQRPYTVLNLAGVNNAFINSWFDSSLPRLPCLEYEFRSPGRYGSNHGYQDCDFWGWRPQCCHRWAEPEHAPLYPDHAQCHGDSHRRSQALNGGIPGCQLDHDASLRSGWHVRFLHGWKL
jgi:hypothetical protein